MSDRSAYFKSKVEFLEHRIYLIGQRLASPTEKDSASLVAAREHWRDMLSDYQRAYDKAAGKKKSAG